MAEKPRPIATLADLGDPSMTGIEVDGRAILLVRRGDRVTAIDGTCPHAGGPLADGVLDGDRVICPWHKAAFCVRTGTCVEPPAVDDLPAFELDIEDGEVWLRPGAAERKIPAPKGRGTFVIVGVGAAGTAAAQTLRAEGFAGRIVMISPETPLPYDRTILSKYVLSGQDAGEKSPLHSADFYRKHEIERLTGAVTAVRPAERRVRLADGTALVYDALLLATGGAPRRPDLPGIDLGNVFTLRSSEDADAIVTAAVEAKSAVVIGTGFIGMEAAASLRERGLEVTVVGPETIPFEKQLGAEIGRMLVTFHESKGVRLMLGTEVARLEGDRAVEAVVLKDGTRIAADIVVIGMGVAPATSWIAELPRAKDGGLEVDPTLRVADGIYAAGDIAKFPLRGDGPRIRVEHWRVAEQHGRLAARNMLGAGAAYDAVPYFWSIQFGAAIDYVGHGSGDDDITVRGDVAERDFIAYYVRDGRVTAAAGMAHDQDMAAVLALMTDRRDWTVDDLHPPHGSPAKVAQARFSKRV